MFRRSPVTEQAKPRPIDPASLFPDLQPGRKAPVHRWNPDFCGQIDMRIARDGSWFYLGTPIGRPALVRLFAGILRREGDGSFVLVTPGEKVGISVDDAPFVAVDVERRGAGEGQELVFRTNVDDVVVADAAHPIRVVEDPVTGEPSPYVMVRDGLEARLLRPVFYRLVDWAEEHGGVLVARSGGAAFTLGRVDA